ncbi:unnamed protein product [Ectocarpus fasciculatus]
METRGVCSKKTQHNKSGRAGLRSSPRCGREAGKNKPGGCDAGLPHHVMLEIVSFLDTRSIVRGRCLSRAFNSDAPALVKTLDFSMGQQSPSAETIKLFSEVRQVNLNGNRDLVHAVVEGLRGWGSSLRLGVSRHRSIKEQEEPLSKAATTALCALPLTELDMNRVVVEFPRLLRMHAWRTLRRLVIRDGLLEDGSLESLFKSIPEGPLPLRHLDLSRNLHGGYDAVSPFADALRSFPDLECLELSACRIVHNSGNLIVRTLLEGACPELKALNLSLNFFTDGLLEFLCEGLGKPGHGLLNLQKLGFGSRVTGDEMITCFDSIGEALAAGGLPKLDFLLLQGDVRPTEVSEVLSLLSGAGCPMLEVVKLERSPRSSHGEDEYAAEEVAQCLFQLVLSDHPHLREVHVLGMALHEGMDKDQEAGRASAFYRATNDSTWHDLAVASQARGIQVFV